MTPIDWQAYDDGSLEAGQRAEAEALLASSPEARAELDGVRRLRERLASLKDTEPVPTARLEAALSRVVKPRFPIWRPALAVVLLAVLAWCAFKVTRPTFSFVGTRRIASLADLSYDESAKLTAERNGLQLGKLDPGDHGRFVRLAMGWDWDRVDLEFYRKDVSLWIRADKGRLDRLPKKVVCERTLYFSTDPAESGVGWKDAGFEFFLTGLPNGDLENLAGRLNTQTATWPRYR